MKRRKNKNKRSQEIDLAVEDAAKIAALATEAELQVRFEKGEESESIGSMYLGHFFGVLDRFLQDRCAMNEVTAEARAKRSIETRMAALAIEEELREKTDNADAGKNNAGSDGSNAESAKIDKNNADHIEIVRRAKSAAFYSAGAVRETVRGIFLDRKVQVGNDVFDEVLEEIFDTHFVQTVITGLQYHFEGVDTEAAREIALEELRSTKGSIAFVRGPSGAFLMDHITATIRSMSDDDMLRLKTVAIAMMNPENPLRERFRKDLRMRRPPSGRPPSGH